MIDEAKEQERLGDWLDAQPREVVLNHKSIDIWLAAKRDDAAQLTEISMLTLDEDPVQGVRNMNQLRINQDGILTIASKSIAELTDQLAAATKRRKAAEKVINWLDTHDLIMMGALEGQEIAVLRDDWQTTIPADEKE